MTAAFTTHDGCHLRDLTIICYGCLQRRTSRFQNSPSSVAAFAIENFDETRVKAFAECVVQRTGSASNS